jgi:hypothetical protein
VGIIDLKLISTTKNSNKFQKTRFWKDKSVENVVTLKGFPFNSSMISFHIRLQKFDTYIAKQCSHVESPYFVIGLHVSHIGHTSPY